MSLETQTLEAFVLEASGLVVLVDDCGRVRAASADASAEIVGKGDASISESLKPPPPTLDPDGFTDAQGREWRAARIAPDAVLLSARATGPDASQRFTAAVSHEIRTPLNGILGMVALLEETPLAPVQKEYASAIRKSGTRLLDLLNNVLDYSRFEAGETPLDDAPFDPRDLIQEVAELISPRAHADGLDIAAVARQDLAETYYGDVGRLRQILFNLAGNAAKFTETGGVLIEARPRRSGDGLRFSVYDTGPGVPSERREDLFTAFSQVSAADAGRDGGVGLGLAIVARLVALMDGEVAVDCGHDGGAAFHVDLPLASAGECAAPADLDAFAGRRIHLDLLPASKWSFVSAFGAAGAQADPDMSLGPPDLAVVDAARSPKQIERLAKAGPTLVVLRPEDRALIPKFRKLGAAGYLIRPMRARSIIARGRLAMTGDDLREGIIDPASAGSGGAAVLIADDNPVNGLLAKRALEADGYKVDVAASGAEALDAAAARNYCVIFMDVRMPVMDGLEASRRIRTLAATSETSAETPIIAVTADVDAELEARALAAGVTLVASKPIDPARLRALASDWAFSKSGAL